MTDIVATTDRPRMLGHTVALTVIGATGLVFATILTIAANLITTRTWDEAGDDAALAALTAWTSVAVTVGVVSLVGAIVLAGAAEIARRAADAVTPQSEKQ
jgi:hypothetical protein